MSQIDFFWSCDCGRINSPWTTCCEGCGCGLTELDGTCVCPHDDGSWDCHGCGAANAAVVECCEGCGCGAYTGDGCPYCLCCRHPGACTCGEVCDCDDCTAAAVACCICGAQACLT